ncbi:hypothetical protein BN2476_1510011 [Paraburkholderia piptadeniae]|uniref:Uncharacterized protein n=1 Tax=Paraburkholderia piptadeniae TaxID=1701573 RepID=A0A1N7SWX9_9BURK|nr:hypothetical protein BN2476_1510011 [Paraburkholderia piptadeniae]
MSAVRAGYADYGKPKILHRNPFALTGMTSRRHNPGCSQGCVNIHVADARIRLRSLMRACTDV